MSAAVVFEEYGGPEVLHLSDVDPGEPGPGQVRVRVRAAGVQPADSLFRRGVMRQFLPARFPQRLGNEFAGVVDAVGPDVSAPAVGTAVIGWAAQVCYAEHVLVPATDLVSKPDSLPWTHAGVLSASGQTAVTTLELLAVTAGDTVLIHAAAGGVGSFAVQLARRSGATVVGTASPRNHEYLRGLGAIPVAYGEGLTDRVRAVVPRVDAALDGSGTLEALQSSVDLVADRSRIGTIAFSPAAAHLGVARLSTQRSAARLARLAALSAAGELTVEIQQAYPLAEAAQAHRDLDTGHVRGKLVLTTEG
jgi:enoyl reductase